ncbi:hypothetical protein [Nocardia crassostreae]|uniref:hypothetical protein n=1 Tax=Nocardia crassostreae TaxID=53428 RepID=UPI0012FC455B|nr:hypothetical protein [Nocardia crassostreae]
MDHANALRDYLARTAPQPERNESTGGGTSATLTRTQSPDGGGWAVCRPQAAWC